MINKNLQSINVNPCKMCMPMGAALAFKGIENSMVLMHGSQGCSTYIRRHISTHFNEPIDIASSSLNEKGTVYGGEENLKKGLKNLLKLYQPGVIGVITTCLAETIGEDIVRMVAEFKREEEINDLAMIPVATPGYGGSQYEGYYLTLRRIVEELATAQSRQSSPKINIITGNLTPADIRKIKRILNLFDFNYTLLPDLSETCDAPFSADYKKIARGGTTIKDIEEMGTAVASIEFGFLVDDNLSPAWFLEKEFAVPLYRLPLPIGLKNVDSFINLLSRLAKKDIPAEIMAERGRMLDGMIDSHKYNAEGRAAIFGEPDLVYALTALCAENGIFPAVVATGTKILDLEKKISKLTDNFTEEPIIIHQADFAVIRKHVQQQGVNLLIGHSDGNFITEKDDIPLVRTGFPIHDRIGAQRELSVVYEGSMRLLDKITNTILQAKHNSYRQDLFERYYLPVKGGGKHVFG
ncbi:nitrogenase [Iocasia frigidifontis]|uniref:Nitrogenase n=1 Tax=Iocasia fonsfrigidae TaxID=2682810 RepID=A0A8A7KCK2_9FIRM|nr:nitrogenase component 1 [Iocasia fonsfrigidae]QTL97119.1 nitrogenase [Iocasia fonsfrigidae]